MIGNAFWALVLSLTPISQTAPPQDSGVIKVFLLAGQSNMEGQAVVDLDHPEHYNAGRGILVTILGNPGIAEDFGHWRNPDGTWRERDDVFVSYQPERGPAKVGALSIGYAGYPGRHHFGPELQLGWELGEHFSEPVLLIKTCWGGKSLMNDFRPPSSGGVVGPCYGRMIDEYRSALAELEDHFPALSDRQPELMGLFWFQGWNDMFTEGAIDAYAVNLSNLVKDLRRELGSPELPFVVGQTGNTNRPDLWVAQEAATRFPDFSGRAAYVPTRDFLRKPTESPNPGHGHHWYGNAESYLRIGQAMGRAMIMILDPTKFAQSTRP